MQAHIRVYDGPNKFHQLGGLDVEFATDGGPIVVSTASGLARHVIQGDEDYIDIYLGNLVGSVAPGAGVFTEVPPQEEVAA
jgi:hypothetical protein